MEPITDIPTLKLLSCLFIGFGFWLIPDIFQIIRLKFHCLDSEIAVKGEEPGMFKEMTIQLLIKLTVQK